MFYCQKLQTATLDDQEFCSYYFLIFFSPTYLLFVKLSSHWSENWVLSILRNSRIKIFHLKYYLYTLWARTYKDVNYLLHHYIDLERLYHSSVLPAGVQTLLTVICQTPVGPFHVWVNWKVPHPPEMCDVGRWPLLHIDYVHKRNTMASHTSLQRIATSLSAEHHCSFQ